MARRTSFCSDTLATPSGTGFGSAPFADAPVAGQRRERATLLSTANILSRKNSVRGTLALTPPLSPGERETLSTTAGSPSIRDSSQRGQRSSPLHGGEGKGEGEPILTE